MYHDQKIILFGLPWHACAPVGKGDWGGIGPGECLARRLTVNSTTRNFVKGQNVKRNSDQDFQPQIGVLSKIIMMTNTMTPAGCPCQKGQSNGQLDQSLRNKKGERRQTKNPRIKQSLL